jgi:hypothetical protein
MPKGQTTQPVDPSKLSTINQLIDQLSLLLADLLTAARATADHVKLIKIHNEYAAVQSIMNQAAQAQAAANDTLFNQVISPLKKQAAILQGLESQIKSIVADVALVGRIVGYAAQAIILLSKL